jgi:hypothetical protein
MAKQVIGNKLNFFAWLNNMMLNDLAIFTNAGAPTNGTSGTFATKAGKGCLLIDVTNGNFYQNTNTKASPTWTLIASGTSGGFVQYAPFANTSLFYELAQTGITAGSTQTQAGATAITGQTAQITTVTTAGDGVKLPASAGGLEVLVVNKGANPVRVYGTGADTIDDQTNTVGVLQMAGSAVIYVCAVAGNWYSEGLATGFGGPGLQTMSFTPSITAGSTQTQAGATALTSMINRISTCATQGNGVALPTSAAGLAVTIINRGAQACQVYGNNTEAATINGIATGTGISQGINTQATYYCNVAGNWEVPLTALWSSSPTLISANGAIPPHVSHTYVITKTGSLAAITLAAPTAGTDDGIEIQVTSDTAFAHTITCPAGVFKNGGAATTIFTFTGTTSGGGLTLMAYNATWKVIAFVGGAFS